MKHHKPKQPYMRFSTLPKHTSFSTKKLVEFALTSRIVSWLSLPKLEETLEMDLTKTTRNINRDPFFMVVFLQGTPIFSQNCHLYFHHPGSPFHSLEEAPSAVVPLLDLQQRRMPWEDLSGTTTYLPLK